MSINFYQTTQCNYPEDSHLHTCCCENLKAHKSTNCLEAVKNFIIFQILSHIAHTSYITRYLVQKEGSSTAVLTYGAEYHFKNWKNCENNYVFRNKRSPFSSFY
jgi:hypothetical protein